MALFSKTDKKSRRKDRIASSPAAEKYGSVSLTSHFAIWVAVWIAALIFTQALLSTASHIFFIFISIIPVVCLVYALISRSALKIFMLSDSSVTEKKTPYDYEFRILNETILPYPFIDAYMKLPQSNSVRTTERCVKLSMSPLSSYTVKSTVQFRFRGTYEIGVCCFYVYDFFRMFRVKVEINSLSTVYVMPRKLPTEDEKTTTAADSATRTKKSPNSYEKLEVSDIREYRMGDALKSIHWKLSSKTEDLIVRDYNTGSTDMSYVFVDMSRHFPDDAPLARPDVSDENKYKGEKKKTTKKSQKSSKNAKTAEKNAPAPVAKSTAPRVGSSALDNSPLIDDGAYEDMNEFCADGVVELAIAVTLRELRAGREVSLVWFDERSDLGSFAFDLTDEADFDLIYRLFSTSALVPGEFGVTRLAAAVSDMQDSKQYYVLPTVDDKTVSDLCTLGSSSIGSAFGGTEVIVYSAKGRYALPDERNAYIDYCRQQLSEHGMKLSEANPDDIPGGYSAGSERSAGNA